MLYLPEHQKIIIWGCGNAGTKIIEKYAGYYRICFLVDKKVGHGEKIENGGYEVYNPEDALKNVADDTIIVIAMYEWEEAARYLQSLGMALMKEFIVLPMFEYSFIDVRLLSALPKEMDIKSFIIKMAQGRKIVAAYGHCHMARHRKILESSKQFLDNFIFLNLPPVNATNDINHALLNEAELWKICDIVLCGKYKFASEYNVINSEKLLKILSPSCKIIYITSAAFTGYFPQHKNVNQDMKEIRFRICWGDKNIDRMLREEKTVDEIIDQILSDDFYNRDYVEKFFNHSLKILEEDEKDCDVKIADFIRDNFRKQILYYSWTHPIIPVLIEIGKRICDQLGITDIDFEKFYEDDFFRMDNNEELIYPSVYAVLDVQQNAERKIDPGHFYKEKLSSEEYISEYVYWFQKTKKI